MFQVDKEFFNYHNSQETLSRYLKKFYDAIELLQLEHADDINKTLHEGVKNHTLTFTPERFDVDRQLWSKRVLRQESVVALQNYVFKTQLVVDIATNFLKENSTFPALEARVKQYYKMQASWLAVRPLLQEAVKPQVVEEEKQKNVLIGNAASSLSSAQQEWLKLARHVERGLRPEGAMPPHTPP
jgi:hypothetical protein